MAERAFITPKVLKWARESARMTMEVAATKAGVTSAKLNEWEEGTSQPTIRQAQELAKAYKRPFALLFLPNIPRDFQPLQDFRRPSATPLGTASVFIMREMQQKQAWISEVLSENNEFLPFVGRYTVTSNPADVAKDILQTLGIVPGRYTKPPLQEWIEKAEAHGIFISRTSFIHSHMKLDSDEMQGFAISDPHAPFVFINSDDWDAPQLFTLVHELAHIWIAASGISNDITPDAKPRTADQYNPIELFCNEVAANALMPTALMRAVENRTLSSSTELFQFVKRLGISSFAFLVRSLNLGLIDLQSYRSLKADADADFRAYVQREEMKKAKQKEADSSGPSPYFLRLLKNGRLFTQMVLDAYKGGHIDPSIASTLLNTQTNKFSKLETFLYR